MGRSYRASPRNGYGYVAAIAISVFFTTAEAVLDHRDEEFLVALDFAVRDAAHIGMSRPGVRRAADAVSDLTAPGLTSAVLMAGIGLFRFGRRREISVLLVGTLSAWALFVALKPVFAVPRPRVLAHHHVAITSYAFPSGHVLMTLIVTGLIGWVLSHRTAPSGTFALYGGAAVVASLVGVSTRASTAPYPSRPSGSLGYVRRKDSDPQEIFSVRGQDAQRVGSVQRGACPGEGRRIWPASTSSSRSRMAPAKSSAR
jgi:membrane-associated phospholipid phosphatase